MKGYILVDDYDIIRCIATEEQNLHKDKLWMKQFRVEIKGVVGDEYNVVDDKWIPRPENYPKEPTQQKRERLIAVQSRLSSVEILNNGGSGIDWAKELSEFSLEKEQLIKEITED